jgi:hypothetical protein
MLMLDIEVVGNAATEINRLTTALGELQSDISSGAATTPN